MRIISIYGTNIPFDVSVICVEGIYINAYVSGKSTSWELGKYKCKERAEMVRDEILAAWLDGKKVFEMPEE